MRGMCLSKDHPLCREEIWPTTEWLENLSANTRRLASLHKRGRESIWDCIKAIENRCPSLKLRNGIEGLVNRAAKFVREPLAITIQRQGMSGNESAKKCFEALKICRNGKSEISSVNWKQHREILKPRKDESCEAKAAQIVIDWLRWTPCSIKALAPLELWLCVNRSSELLSKVVHPDFVNPFETFLVNRKRNRIKERNSIRQKRRRLRKKRLALSRSLRSQRRQLHDLVRRELEIIESCNSTEEGPVVAARRLIHYTRRTPEEWKRFFVKKA